MLRSIIVTFIVCMLSPKVHAKDFGTNGNIWGIEEQPFIEMMKDRLQKVDMNKERKKMEALAKERINDPGAIRDIVPAVKSRTFYYDPTYILDQDAILPCGNILHKAGTRVNALDHMQFNRRLFFIDARRNEQVIWLKQQLKSNSALGNLAQTKEAEQIEDRVILVGGSPLKLEEEIGQEVYFDQQGALTNKFGIKHSPALVEQEGMQLKIKEFKLF